MPNWRTHFALSNKRTGKFYEELHKWIDKNSEDDLSVDHRNNGRHIYTEQNRKFVFDNFGGNEAVSEWLFHIAIDNLDTSVSNDWMNKVSDNNFHVFGFKGNGFIFYDEYFLNEKELEDEFYD